MTVNEFIKLVGEVFIAAVAFFKDQWLLLTLGLLVFLIYFLPWLTARSRGHPNSAAIGILNLLLGWTLLGWVVAMVWAVMKTPFAPSTSVAMGRPGSRQRRMP